MIERFLDDLHLSRSEVVANAAMNRERHLRGANSYEKDLGFSPLAVLEGRLREQGAAAWLDLCCGSGRALIQAAEPLQDQPVRLVGVDLVPYFDAVPAGSSNLRLEVRNLSDWSPSEPFDLITCVHGLHYVGDKLGLLARALSWLTPGGHLAGHLDLNNICVEGGTRAVSRLLREWGVEYDRRRRLVRAGGRREVSLPWEYLGADDRAGPNYTGQPAVHSYYRPR